MVEGLVFRRLGAALVCASLATTAWAAEIATPAQALARSTHRLESLPNGWITTRPIQLDVAFNLRYPPGSADAQEFLQSWYRSINALPDHVQLRLLRIVTPAKYAYSVSLVFDDWNAYRAYESSDAFLRYYRGQWKPAVTDVEERMSVVDPITDAFR